MRLTALLACLSLLVAAPAVAAPADGGIDTDDRIAQRAAKKKTPKGKKSKKGKKGKKGKAEPTPEPPPPDSDGDGVLDDSDKCPEEAEDIDMFEDEDGCPDKDNDGDGIEDSADDCPFEAETVDGWTDEDGCPEAAAVIKPFTLEATLVDGTKLKGTVIRITAVDEDEKGQPSEEPEGFDVVTGEAEWTSTWDNLKSFKSEKVAFTEAVDCYSEGIEELGDERPTWECTLRHPTVLKLATAEHKGTSYYLDRKMKRLDLQLQDLSCEGDSCESVTSDNTLSVYLYKLISQEKSDDETGAVTTLQKRLRKLQQMQIKSATITAIEAAE